MGLPAGGGFAADRLALIVPTSLCSGQIARRIAERLNESELVSAHGISRFVALPHTEGCGVSSGENEDHFTRTMVGHLLHPFVREALLLEHGCERTHNDLMRHVMEQHGVDPERFGYASIQLDGGIDKVTSRVETWFRRALASATDDARCETGLEALSLGLSAEGAVPAPVAAALADIAATIAASGGKVIIAANASLLSTPEFLARLGWQTVPSPSLEYGQPAGEAGMHIMSTPGNHWVETSSGLGGTGVQLMLVHIEHTPLQSHPMVPLVQIASDASLTGCFLQDLDAMLDPEAGSARNIAVQVLQLLCSTASGDYLPRSQLVGNTDFQLTRGLLGVSL